VEVITRGEPACLVCHWTGIYFNGEEVGFRVFQEVVRRVHARFDNLVWMKLSEISRYWAAKELTRIRRHEQQVEFHAPFAAPDFTIEIFNPPAGQPRLQHGSTMQALEETSQPGLLRSGRFLRQNNKLIACFDLPRGISELRFAS
jgi:hypothetical protein